MLHLVTLAAASAALGWPCTRMNWAWRNVWSTCSILSYHPHTAAGNDFAPAHFRMIPMGPTAPPGRLLGAGFFAVPGTAPAGVPQFTCNNMLATGTDLLRNRCRRAVDAYGGIVQACQLPPATAGGRGPIAGSIYNDHLPAASQNPHAQNIAALSAHFEKCWTDVVPLAFRTPERTCPGLLGWFNVVWNACNFASAHGTAPAVTPSVAPLGGSFVPNRLLSPTGPLSAVPSTTHSPRVFLCSPVAGAEGTPTNPLSWNRAGPSFRSTRCRRAMDQFGRAALRCDVAQGQPAKLGYRDPLKIFAGYPNNVVGAVGAALPMSLNALAPLCN